MYNKTPFRYDHVGSFLRPEYLKEARKQYEQGEITKEQLTEVEDKAITELVVKEMCIRDRAADYKAKNNKYKKFIKKYEKKINEMKNNQKLVDEFLEDYNKITEK